MEDKEIKYLKLDSHFGHMNSTYSTQTKRPTNRNSISENVEESQDSNDGRNKINIFEPNYHSHFFI